MAGHILTIFSGTCIYPGKPQLVVAGHILTIFSGTCIYPGKPQLVVAGHILTIFSGTCRLFTLESLNWLWLVIF